MENSSSRSPEPTPLCVRNRSLLALLRTGALSPREAAVMHEHVSICPWCQQELAAYDALDATARQHLANAAFTPLTLQDFLHASEVPSDANVASTPGASRRISQHSTEEIMHSILNRTERDEREQTAAPRRPPFLRRSWLSGLARVAAVLVLVGLAAALFGGRLGFGPSANYGPLRNSFPGTTGSLASISMVSPNEGWALGQVLKDKSGNHPLKQVALYHYLHGVWTPVYVTTSQDMSEGGAIGFNGTISMDSASDGWAVAHNFGLGSVVLHYSNGAWNQVDAPTIFTLQAFSPKSVWAISWLGSEGDGIVHYDGTNWTLQSITGGTFNQQGDVIAQGGVIGGVIGIDMVSDHEGWALATGLLVNGSRAMHYFVLRYTGGAWSVYTTFSPADDFASVNSLAGFSILAMVSPNEGWVIGERSAPNAQGQTGPVYHYLNGHWTSMALTGANRALPYVTLKRIVMVSPTDSWIIGTQNRTNNGSTAPNFEQQTILFHYSGGKWTQVQVPTTGTAVNEITGLAFTPDGQGWACGYASDIPVSTVYQDTNILANSSPELWTYQNGAWTLYQQG